MQDLRSRYLVAKRALFDKVFGARLNPEQCRAVFTTEGPVLVLAGAGSGKTTVLVNRISYIIKYGNAYFSQRTPDNLSEYFVKALEEARALSVEELEEILPDFIDAPCPPWQVLAFTFTNKAAGEIRDRLLSTFDDAGIASAVWAGTFHSICLRILRKHAGLLGYGDGFSIYDTDDAKRLVAACMKELSIDEKSLAVKRVCREISMSKDSLTSPADYETTSDFRTRDIKRVYELYQKKLKEYNAMDFDDIIMNTVLLLRENTEALTYYQRQFRYVLIDEFQDTNFAQFELALLLSGGYDNLMVVGDDDQSIYKFRGATIENILHFDEKVCGTKIIKLEENYRSTANILNAANSVIRHNFGRRGKELWTGKGDGEKVVVKQFETQNDESRYIVNKIMELARHP